MSNPSFMEELHKAYQAGRYTDLKITCGSAEFNVHKIILCSQSKVFDAMCSGSFMEASSNTINLTDDGLNLIARFVGCLYFGTYDDFNTEGDDAEYWKSPHQLHAAMFALADKYDCTALKQSALAKFKEHATKHTVQDQLGFIASIPIIYESTPDSERALRDVVVNNVQTAPYHFLAEDVKPHFQKLLLEVPEFSWDLHQSWMTLLSNSMNSESNKRRR